MIGNIQQEIKSRLWLGDVVDWLAREDREVHHLEDYISRKYPSE